MRRHHSLSENGQSMVIIAIFMVVLIAMLALVIDGGLGYTKRREAQNAADAAALAGADALCDSDFATVPRTIAEEYVLLNGGNTPAYEDIVIGDDEVTVTAHITHPTFFAGILGSDEITASATATAGCYVPCNVQGVLPVAWACQPPVGEEAGEECAVQYGPDNMYIIMDSEKYPSDIVDACIDPITGLPENGLNCDLDGDDVNDVLPGGERSWLDLDGGGGGQLSDWIENGYPNPIYTHSWLGPEQGNIVSIYHTLYDQLQDLTAQGLEYVVLLPVFDAMCDGWPETTPGCEFHDGPPPTPVDIPPDEANVNALYWHIISFSYFRITCIDDGPHSSCPDSLSLLLEDNPDLDTPNFINTLRMIEGYFVQDYAGTGACDGPGTGVYTIYLK